MKDDANTDAVGQAVLFPCDRAEYDVDHVHEEERKGQTDEDLRVVVEHGLEAHLTALLQLLFDQVLEVEDDEDG